MTKKNLTLLCFVLSVFLSNSISAQTKFENWKELKEFHKVMAQTFHPSEEGNLEPIKTRSAEMAEKAAALKKSSIPTEFDRKEVRAAVKQLAKDSKKLDKMVKNKAADADITKSLSALHDVFHRIVGLCSNEDHH